MTPAVRSAVAMVNVIVPAAVILTGVANTGTAFNTASSESVALAVAPLIDVVLDPADVPMACLLYTSDAADD